MEWWIAVTIIHHQLTSPFFSSLLSTCATFPVSTDKRKPIQFFNRLSYTSHKSYKIMNRFILQPQFIDIFNVTIEYWWHQINYLQNKVELLPIDSQNPIDLKCTKYTVLHGMEWNGQWEKEIRVRRGQYWCTFDDLLYCFAHERKMIFATGIILFEFVCKYICVTVSLYVSLSLSPSLSWFLYYVVVVNLKQVLPWSWRHSFALTANENT